ncbi:MAG TPA: hypothetical protein VKX45_06990 [Bryobacteraceae bacterium]|nr:hypothetical protein [Bryobacteraceae bacterium]
MPGFDGCATCSDLLDAVRHATQRHIEALSRLQSAAINQEIELAEALAIVVRETRAERERRTAAYRTHRDMHRVARSGMTA